MKFFARALGSVAAIIALTVLLPAGAGGRLRQGLQPGGCADGVIDQDGTECILASSSATSSLLFPYPGRNNTFEAPAAVAAGDQNIATGAYSFIGGGRFSIATGDYATVGGGQSNRATGMFSTVGGGESNLATAGGSTVSGGLGNGAYGYYSTVGGGGGNYALDESTTIGGGFFNSAAMDSATVGGGTGNDARGRAATIGGGRNNEIVQGDYSTISGGAFNRIFNDNGTICGGDSNFVGGRGATVCGGQLNRATGDYSFAAGRQARAEHDGAFVWSSSSGSSSAPNQFNIYASGGTRIFSNPQGTTGVQLAPGAGSWTTVSDRNAKENFVAVDGREVLDKLAELPILTWNYKSQDDSIRHMGPMAQDFWEAFGLGLGDTTIDTVDPDGVALAAIQGLRQEKDEALARQAAEIAELQQANQEMHALLEAAKARLAELSESDPVVPIAE